MDGTILTNIAFTLLTFVMPITLTSSHKEMLETISKYNKHFSKKWVKKVSNIGIFLILTVLLLWLVFLFGFEMSYHIPFMAYLLTHSYFAGVCLLVCDVASSSNGHSYKESQEDSQLETEEDILQETD